MASAARVATLIVGIGLGFGLHGHASAETKLARGKYLATLMDCGGCHTPGTFLGKPDFTRYLAGADVGWAIPGMGVFYPSNLTPDKETGIGSWSKADIIKLLRTGVTPEGREVAPMMPWRSYRNGSDADLDALAEFLMSVPPIHNGVPGPTKLEDVKSLYVTVVAPPPK